MADRLFYSAFAVKPSRLPAYAGDAGREVTAWTAAVGGVRITDVTSDAAGTIPVTTITTDGTGSFGVFLNQGSAPNDLVWFAVTGSSANRFPVGPTTGFITQGAADNKFSGISDDTPTGTDAGATPATGRSLFSNLGTVPTRMLRMVARSALRTSTFKPAAGVVVVDDAGGRYTGDGNTEERALVKAERYLVARIPSTGNNRALLEDLDGYAVEQGVGILLAIAPKTTRPYNINTGGDFTFSNGVSVLGGGIDITTIRNTSGTVNWGKITGFTNGEPARSFGSVSDLTIDRFGTGPVASYFGWLSRGTVNRVCWTGTRAPDTASGEDPRLQPLMVKYAQNLEFRRPEIRNNSGSAGGTPYTGGGGIGGTGGASNITFYHRVIRDNDGWGERYWWEAPPAQIAITQGYCRNWRAIGGLTEDNGKGNVLIESGQALRWVSHQMSLPKATLVGGVYAPPPVFAMVNTQTANGQVLGPIFWDGSAKGSGIADDGNQYGTLFHVERGHLFVGDSLMRNAANLFVVANAGRVFTSNRVTLAASVKSEGRVMQTADSPTGTGTNATRPFRLLVRRGDRQEMAPNTDTTTTGTTPVNVNGMVFDQTAVEELRFTLFADHTGDPANGLQLSWTLPTGGHVQWRYGDNFPVTDGPLNIPTTSGGKSTRIDGILYGATSAGFAQLQAAISAGTMTGSTQTVLAASSRMVGQTSAKAGATEDDG